MKYKILDRKKWYSSDEKKLYENGFYLPANMVGASHIKVTKNDNIGDILDVFISLLNTESVDKILVDVQYGSITVKRFKGDGHSGISNSGKTLGILRIRDLATMLGQC